MNKLTIARPYAKAVFAIALEEASLDRWSELFSFWAAFSLNAKVAALYNDPHWTHQQLAQLFIDVTEKEVKNVTENVRHFLQLLALNKRLCLLPEMAQVFRQYRAALEKTARVEVTTARPLTKSTVEELTRVLNKRLQCHTQIQFSEDKTLIGGAVIRVADSVIDGSVRGKLDQMRQALLD